MQLLCGVVVSTDPDADCWFGIQQAGDNVQTSAMSKQVQCHHTTTKGASCLTTTDSDKAEYHTAASSLFENLSFTKDKQQKRHSSSPLPGAGPKQKRGRWSFCLFSVNLR